MTRLLLLVVLAACTGSPDAVTVGAGRNTMAYDNSAGAPAYDAQGYSYGASLTWYLPSTNSMREQRRDEEMIDLLRRMERNTHDAVITSMEPTVVQGPPVVYGPPLPPEHDEKKPTDDSMTLTLKASITGLVIAFAAVLTAVLKGMLKNRSKIAGIERKTKEAKP